MAKSLPPYIVEMTKKIKEAEDKLPDALSKQKIKFLIAINKNTANKDFTVEDDKFVQEVMHNLKPMNFEGMNYLSLFWNDSSAINFVTSVIERNALFELSNYLNSAKIVCLAYSGSITTQVFEAAEYVLTHARQFGDPSNTIFQCDVKSSLKQIEAMSTPLPSSKFMNNIQNLIDGLRSCYDEMKFRKLNTNVTYITLLMLRRLVRDEAQFLSAMKRIQTHNSYLKLCPWPLHNELPKSDMSKLEGRPFYVCAYLVIYAYFNVDDEKTKKVLEVTCLQYMKWNGLHLPNLFFRVIEIYDIDEGELWDLLSCEKTATSLTVLADDYYVRYKMLQENPTKTQNWFPYCRVLMSEYHRDLSASQNEIICVILAYLIDLKIGLDKSSVRQSHWAKTLALRPWLYNFAVQYANNIYKNINKQ